MFKYLCKIHANRSPYDSEITVWETVCCYVLFKCFTQRRKEYIDLHRALSNVRELAIYKHKYDNLLKCYNQMQAATDYDQSSLAALVDLGEEHYYEEKYRIF